MRISTVRVEGADKTRSSFLRWMLKPHQDHFSDLDPNDYNLENVLKATKSMTHSLMSTGIFTTVEPTIEKAQDVLSNYGDVDVVLRTKQKGRLFLKTSTEVGDQEGSVVRDNFTTSF